MNLGINHLCKLHSTCACLAVVWVAGFVGSMVQYGGADSGLLTRDNEHSAVRVDEMILEAWIGFVVRQENLLISYWCLSVSWSGVSSRLRQVRVFLVLLGLWSMLSCICLWSVNQAIVLGIWREDCCRAGWVNAVITRGSVIERRASELRWTSRQYLHFSSVTLCVCIQSQRQSRHVHYSHSWLAYIAQRHEVTHSDMLAQQVERLYWRAQIVGFSAGGI